jgi:UDP-sugar transporter A1/2/3
MRYTRSTPGESSFLPSTAVLCAEGVKLAVCLAATKSTEGSLVSIYENKGELLKTSLPALLYLVQNNLLYYAVGKLDAATYAVVCQSKVVFVALLSVTMLGKVLSCLQWLSLLLLMIGVACVQISGQSNSASPEDMDIETKERLLGLLGILAGALCTSLAGVYFELMLKKGVISLYARNVQLASYSIVIGLVGVAFTGDGLAVKEHGFFQGYTMLTVVVVLLQALGE